jgi:4-oxalocrotonate tautomerase
MPLVRMELWAGVAQDTKEKLAREITDVIVRNVGCPAQAVTLIFNEVPKRDWMIGGRPCSELFKDVK